MVLQGGDVWSLGRKYRWKIRTEAVYVSGSKRDFTMYKIKVGQREEGGAEEANGKSALGYRFPFACLLWYWRVCVQCPRGDFT